MIKINKKKCNPYKNGPAEWKRVEYASPKALLTDVYGNYKEYANNSNNKEIIERNLNQNNNNFSSNTKTNVHNSLSDYYVDLSDYSNIIKHKSKDVENFGYVDDKIYI